MSSSSYTDPGGIEVIDESDIVVLNVENSDSSFKSEEDDLEMIVLEEEEDPLDDIEELNAADGLVPGVEEDFTDLEEGEADDASSSGIARETVNDATRPKTDEGGLLLSREGQETEGSSTPPGGTASGSNQAPFAPAAMSSGCCSCPGKLTVR